MKPAKDHEVIIKAMRDRYGKDTNSHVIGILIANPNKTFVKDEILNNIEYADTRSGLYIDFFFAGYSSSDTHDEQQIIIKAPNGKKWYFNFKIFNDFINQLEKISKWKYSGETEFLLLEFKQNELHFDKVISIWLDKAVKEGNIYSASSLFEDIYRIARARNETNKFSDALAVGTIKGSIFDFICSFLHESLKNIVKSTAIYVVKDYSKN
jgi:hypothetical protein